MNTQTQSIINIPLKVGTNQYPVAQGAPRKIMSMSGGSAGQYSVTMWVDRSVTPEPCAITLAKAGTEVSLLAGQCIGQIGNLWAFSTCFG